MHFLIPIAPLSAIQRGAPNARTTRVVEDFEEDERCRKIPRENSNTHGEEGRAFQKDGLTVEKDIIWAIVVLTHGAKRQWRN